MKSGYFTNKLVHCSSFFSLRILSASRLAFDIELSLRMSIRDIQFNSKCDLNAHSTFSWLLVSNSIKNEQKSVICIAILSFWTLLPIFPIFDFLKLLTRWKFVDCLALSDFEQLPEEQNDEWQPCDEENRCENLLVQIHFLFNSISVTVSLVSSVNLLIFANI